MVLTKKITPRFTRDEWHLLNFISRVSGAFAAEIESVLNKGFMTEAERYKFAAVMELNTVDRYGKSITDRRAA